MSKNQSKFQKKNSSQNNLFATQSSINSVYVERNDDRRKITFYVPAYIYLSIYNASDIKIQDRNIKIFASIRVRFDAQGISEYLSNIQMLKLLGIQQQDLCQIDLQKLYSPKYSLKHPDRKKIVMNFGLNKSKTLQIAENTINDQLSLKSLITLEINQDINFTVQQSTDWWYRHLYIFTPTYLLNLQESITIQNLVIPINFTTPIQEEPYTIEYSFNFMEAPKQSQKFKIHPKLLQTFGQYQCANNLICINFSNLKQNRQYLNQRKITQQEHQFERKQQKYLSSFDQFTNEFLDLEDNVKNVRRQLSEDSEHQSEGLIETEELFDAKTKWRILYQKHHMKTKQALRYAFVFSKNRQVREVTFRNWKYAHFQIPIYKRPLRDIFTVSIPLIMLAIVTFYFFWQGRSLVTRQAFALSIITVLIIVANALIPITRISKPPIIGVGFYEIMIFLSMIPPLLLLLYIGIANTEEELLKSFDEAQQTRQKYMITALAFQCLLVLMIVFSTTFYCCLRRKESLRSKSIHEDRTCCLNYHFFRLQHSQHPRGKILNLKKWYNNECCRNFALYGKRRLRDWQKQYISRRNLNLQDNNLNRKQFIKLPLHVRSGSKASNHVKNEMNLHFSGSDFNVSNHLKNETLEDAQSQHINSDARLKLIY